MADHPKKKVIVSTGKKATAKSAVRKQVKPSRSFGRSIANFFRRSAFQFALFIITFIVFGNSLSNGYALDDVFYTEHHNKLTQQGFKGIPEIFRTNTFFNNDGTGYSYRPVTLASFAIEIQFFGENPHTSHKINVLIYALTIVLIFGLLRRWFSTLGDWFAFFVCLLFLVHPVHAEAVDNIKSRDELLALFFAVITTRLVFRYIDQGKIIYLFLAPLVFVAAELSKPTIIPFLALIPLSVWFFSNAGWKKILLCTAALLATLIVVKLILVFGVPRFTRKFQDFENPLSQHRGFGTLSATAFYVLGRYLWLHFIPHPLVYYYGYKYVDIVNWSNWIAIISLVIYTALGIVALRGLKKKTPLSFGLIFFLVNMAVFSNIVSPAPGLMAERFTYASSLGFSIVIVWLIFYFSKKDPAAFRWKNPEFSKLRFVLLGICLLYSIRTFIRNEDWENKDVLYKHDMQYLGNSAKANMLLAELYSERAMEKGLHADSCRQVGNLAAAQQDSLDKIKIFLEARGYYKKASEIAPYYRTAWSNLGTTYFYLGSRTNTQPYRDALPFFLRSIKEDPKYGEGLLNAGKSYQMLGIIDSAEYYFKLAIQYDSTSLRAYEELSMINMREKNDTTAAFYWLRLSAKHNPKSDEPWMAMGQIYLKLKDTASAARTSAMAAQINPNNYQRLEVLSNYFRNKGDMEKSNHYADMLEAAARDNPDNTQLMALMVNFYGARRDSKTNYYLGMLEDALDKNPNDLQAMGFLINVLRSQNNMEKANHYLQLMQQVQQSRQP